MPSSRYSKRRASPATASPTASKPPGETLREAVLRTWEDWDQAPGNDSRACIFADACHAFAGRAANDLRRVLAAGRRAGLTYADSLTAWEEEW